MSDEQSMVESRWEYISSTREAKEMLAAGGDLKANLQLTEEMTLSYPDSVRIRLALLNDVDFLHRSLFKRDEILQLSQELCDAFETLSKQGSPMRLTLTMLDHIEECLHDTDLPDSVRDADLIMRLDEARGHLRHLGGHSLHEFYSF